MSWGLFFDPGTQTGGDWPSEPSRVTHSDLEGSGCCCNEMEKEHHASSLIELVLMALKFISVSHCATIFNAFIQHLGVHTGVSAGAPGKVKATCIAIGDSSGTEAIRLGSCCFNYDFRRLLSYSQSWDSSTICLLVAGCMTEVSNFYILALFHHRLHAQGLSWDHCSILRI